MSGQYPKRLIEVDLPIARISAQARREKSIGPLSKLHIWWARRPLVACRAVILASLWPDPVDLSKWGQEETDVPAPPGCKPGEGVVIRPGRFLSTARDCMARWAKTGLANASAQSASRLVAIQKNPGHLDNPGVLRETLLDFIADFADWDRSQDRDYVDIARALVQAAHEALGGEVGSRPLVVDPFAGGGAIPVEALRVGADCFASDLNPVAVLLNKTATEYIPRYGKQLRDDVEKWGAWIKREAAKELTELYPNDPDGGMPIAYLWAKTIRCEGPSCGVEVPIFRGARLSKGRDETARLVLSAKRGSRGSRVDIKVLITSDTPKEDLGGTVRRGSVTCPVCGFTLQRTRVETVAKAGGLGERLLAIVLGKPGHPGRVYRSASKRDEDCFRIAAARLLTLEATLPDGLSTVPTERLPYLRSIFNVHVYGITTWAQLFNERQLFAAVTFSRLARLTYHLAERESGDSELASAVATVLALAVDRQINALNRTCYWNSTGQKMQAGFARQAIPMFWDYCEASPFGSSVGSWDSMVDCVLSVFDSVGWATTPAKVTQASATHHPLPDESVDAVITDPPYYDAVPYADLSDFFYVWLRRMLREIHPSLFTSELSPKQQEVVQLAERNPVYAYKTRENFETLMTISLAEARRIAKVSSLTVIVFAHQSTTGWEAMLTALIAAGWIVTASWPIDTEMPTRVRARNSAVLASSVHLVCRPRKRLGGTVLEDEIGDWRDILRELPGRMHEWMPRLAAEGVVGADAIFACLGPALEIFSRYSQVEKISGEVVTLKEYLEQVWAAVAKEALSMIFADADATGFEADARLTAMWLWTLNAGKTDTANGEEAEEDEAEDESEAGQRKVRTGGFVLEYDAARKIAQGLGAHLEDLGSLVEVTGQTARLLPVGERTRHLFGREAGPSAADGQARRKKPRQGNLFEELEAFEIGARVAGSDVQGLRAGGTVLDRVHQSMILFGAGRGEALKRFLIEDGVGKDGRFWRLADALAALYPRGTDERRWVEGVLARKKGLGF